MIPKFCSGKTLGAVTALFMGIGLFAPQASAAILSRADVGMDDLLLGGCDIPNASPEQETQCAKDIVVAVLGGDPNLITIVTKDITPSFMELTDDAGVFAMLLAPQDVSSFFLVKTGETVAGCGLPLDGCGSNIFLFQNLAQFQYAVLNLGIFGIENIGKVSHITTVMPIPAAAWLFLSALGGLFVIRRRRDQGEPVADIA